MSWGQFVTITGTVKDPSGNAYAGGNGRVLLVSGNGSGSQSWSFSPGNNINPVVVITGLDSFGVFSTRLANTSLILPQSAQPKWQFQFCSQDGATCFTMTPMALTTSQDISATIQAQAASLPGSGAVVTTGTLGQVADVSIPNDTTGTTVGLLAKWNGTNLVTCGTADTTAVCLPMASFGSTPMCSAGTSGNGCWIQIGRAPCTFDAGGSTATSLAPHFVINSVNLPGRCEDAGAGYPSGSYIVGTVYSSVAPNQSGVIYVRSAFSQLPTGYSTWQNAAVSVASRTKTKIVGGFMVATDNVGNASTDLTLGGLGMIDGTDIAPALYTASTLGVGEYLKKDTIGGNGWMVGHAGSVWMRWAGAMQFAAGVQIGWYTNNSFNVFLAGICRTGNAGEVSIDAGNCGTGTGTGVMTHAKQPAGGGYFQHEINAGQHETFQVQQFGATTATAAGAGATADTTYTWTTAFSDANYFVVCTPIGTPTGNPAWVGVISQSQTQITVRVVAITAVASSYPNVDCRGDR